MLLIIGRISDSVNRHQIKYWQHNFIIFSYARQYNNDGTLISIVKIYKLICKRENIMIKDNTGFYFQQIHIDIARNATDDFNLFHDPYKWHKIKNNPFDGSIALGFQIESLIEERVSQFRFKNDEQQLIIDKGLSFSNYQFTFANAVKVGQEVVVDIKKSQFKSTAICSSLSNRVAVKADGKLALMGYKKESTYPLFLEDVDFSDLGDLRPLADRSIIPESVFFLKRKFMNTSNAKNFLCASFTDQSIYFDELNNVANFPEIFPCSLISCALLEKAQKNKHDFEENPLVYTSHKITIDRTLLAKLKSNDALHILIKENPDQPNTYECYGLVDNNKILYRGIISLTTLQSIL